MEVVQIQRDTEGWRRRAEFELVESNIATAAAAALASAATKAKVLTLILLILIILNFVQYLLI